jgi:hypothetical protein
MDNHAVIVHFLYGIEELDPLYSLEDELAEKILLNNVGEFDGHEIAMDNSDGYLYMYGPNAEDLFKAIKPILEACKFMKGAKAVMRFGPKNDASEIEVEIKL